MDEYGTLYGGDLEHGSVVGMTLDPSTHQLNSKLFVRNEGKLSWADGFAIYNGHLYIADSHLWEVSFKNHLPRSGPFTIFKVKLLNPSPHALAAADVVVGQVSDALDFLLQPLRLAATLRQ